MAWLICLRGIVWREVLRFLHQRARFFGALVRPLLWLFVFAAGVRSAVDIGTVPPYGTAVPYEVYIVPGLIGMILLFNGMQSSLSLVYDREMGSMRMLLTSPLPRWWLLACKLLAGVAVSLVQVYAFLGIVAVAGIPLPPWGALAVLPALVAAGLMLGALGMVLSSAIRQLENFAGVMNFVVFPLFFLSSALYPLARMTETSPALARLCAINPFSHAVELIRHALSGQVDATAAAVTAGAAVLFLALAVWGYDPGRGAVRRRAGGTQGG